MGIKTVPQPPYSPDLGLCDFCLFHKLRGCRYKTIEEMKEAVFRTLLSILTDLNNAVVWTVSLCPLISKSSSSFSKLLEIVPRASITIGITVIFMFHSFFSALARFRYLSLFSFYFIFTLLSACITKSTMQ